MTGLEARPGYNPVPVNFLKPAQVGALRTATEAPEWKSDLEKNVWADAFVAGEAFRKELDQDYGEMRSVLSGLGLAE